MTLGYGIKMLSGGELSLSDLSGREIFLSGQHVPVLTTDKVERDYVML